MAHPQSEAADAAALSALAGDREPSLDLVALSEAAGAPLTLVRAIVGAGLLPPASVDRDGIDRYTAADVTALQAGMDLLDAGLPLIELLDLAVPTDRALREIAESAVEVFIRFVRDPSLSEGTDDPGAARRMVAASTRMLPAMEHLVIHHLRRCITAAAAARMARMTAQGDPPHRDVP